MVKKQMIADLSLNTHINDIFFLKNIEFRVRRDKKTIDMFFKIADLSLNTHINDIFFLKKYRV
ncbi:unnamed protein product [marine sediment metagenome]|uniref:Uncharacterized protein n=1 Tax=marine sediment metagenome TaxID=412755 RepID=X1TGZ7_9ZZZZ